MLPRSARWSIMNRIRIPVSAGRQLVCQEGRELLEPPLERVVLGEICARFQDRVPIWFGPPLDVFDMTDNVLAHGQQARRRSIDRLDEVIRHYEERNGIGTERF